MSPFFLGIFFFLILSESRECRTNMRFHYIKMESLLKCNISLWLGTDPLRVGALWSVENIECVPVVEPLARTKAQPRSFRGLRIADRTTNRAKTSQQLTTLIVRWGITTRSTNARNNGPARRGKRRPDRAVCAPAIPRSPGW